MAAKPKEEKDFQTQANEYAKTAIENLSELLEQAKQEDDDTCIQEDPLSVKSQGHHSDYSLPYSIHWLCRKHHQIADKLRTENVIYKRSTIIEIERKRRELSSKLQ